VFTVLEHLCASARASADRSPHSGFPDCPYRPAGRDYRVDEALGKNPRIAPGGGAGTGSNREKNFNRDSGFFREGKQGAPFL
jgi:hypothetical protein